MNIIINGGTRGIGKEIVLFLARDQSNNILVTGRNAGDLKVLADNHVNVRTLAIDLTEPGGLTEVFVKGVSDYFKTADILINVAGLLVAGDFMKIGSADARAMMETNFFGPALVIRLLKPMMGPGSHIVNISSMGGFQGSVKYPGLAYYSASKAALACLTECLAIEFSSSGICVNCLALGSVQTEMFGKAFPGSKAAVDPENMAEYISVFALTGHRFYNGKILPVAVNNP